MKEQIVVMSQVLRFIDMMSWEETIVHIREQPDYRQLVEDAYYLKDPLESFYKFYQGEEYHATKACLKKYHSHLGKKILDLGAGHGLSSVAFAKDGYDICAVEPEGGFVVGVDAIRKLQAIAEVPLFKIIQSKVENLNIEEGKFDIVYARQSMHHADHLNNFVKKAFTCLKPGGLFMTVRDHVINDGQLDEFQATHPLNKFYQGEYAYTLEEYLCAFRESGFKLKEVFRPYDSPINYYPKTTEQMKEKVFKTTFGQSSEFIFKCAQKYLNYKNRNVAGRLYSFILEKPK